MHIYEREVMIGAADSLDRIASLIEPGKTVLDLGMGTGALGRHLVREKSVVADGVTLSPQEAEHAQGTYRKIVVADLDSANILDMFAHASYDYVVCADVFEHLKAPEHLLTCLPALLAPGGMLLASIPNAAYAGLIAELLAGDFRYRPEGLLDQTHLRFFTRRSIERWLTTHGWRINAIQRVQRPLSESEFKHRIDALPPAVASYLISGPESWVYQYVVSAQPLLANGSAVTEDIPSDTSSCADFVAQLYWAERGVFDESRKVVRRGQIGQEDQELVFELPARPLNGCSGLKFDPSDRVGYLRLLHMRLSDHRGETLWSWNGDNTEHQSEALRWPRNDVVLKRQEGSDCGLYGLIYGPDPAIDLPLSEQALRRLDAGGARLSVRLGWPMSADYSALVGAIKEGQHDAAHMALLEEHGRQRAALQTALDTTEDERQRLLEQTRQLQYNLKKLTQAKLQLAAEQLQLQAQLRTMEGLLIFRATRPLARLKMKVLRAFKPSTASGASANLPAVTPPPLQTPTVVAVDIVVPVYRSLDDTRVCLQSLVSCTYAMPVRLVVINDCSPEPALVEWLEHFAQLAHPIPVALIHNPQNLGFVGTVNKGMRMGDQADVVLVNSDAVTANNWLDRLQAAAYRTARVATATPFSNNATICSYPRFCHNNTLPAGETVATLDALCAQHLSAQSVDVPTAHGFCMYIRREALQAVGLFDEANFGKGYGEENDFCVRATEAGWRHVHALDVFVQHAGGVSFGDSKALFESRAMQTMRRLHPGYETSVHEFIGRDPAAPARRVLDVARILQGNKPVILNITHNREGGTLRHQHELARHLGAQALFLQLQPCAGGVALRLCGDDEELEIRFALPSQHQQLVDLLQLLSVRHIHFHHLLDQPAEVLQLPAQLGVRHDFTVHDYYSYCPQISLTDRHDQYCGEKSLEQCRACLGERPAPNGLRIEQWQDRHRSLLEQARYVICPTPGVAERITRFAPEAHTVVSPHPDIDASQMPLPSHPGGLQNRPMRVVVIGALSKIKGADVLEQTAQLAARSGALLEFHLVGYGYRKLATLPNLTVHGAYEDTQLPQLLASVSADVAWFPVRWPETYCYTLSACLSAGLPIVASDTGAFSDRLQQRPLTWLHPWDSSPQTWLQHLMHIRESLVSAAPAHVSQTSMPPSAAAWHYATHYLSDLSEQPATPDAFSPASLAPDEVVKLLASLGVMNQDEAAQHRDRALRLLTRLKTAPGLAWLVRRIPTHVQRRIKSWLIGNR